MTDLAQLLSEFDRMHLCAVAGRADGLQGEHVDFTGSHFEHLEFSNTRIN